MGIPSIAPRELADRLDAGEPVDLIDVRTPAEFREVHAAVARSEPLATLDPRALMEGRDARATGPLYLICHSGTRAKDAWQRFRACGCEDAVVVEGGTAAWERAGLPVVRGKKAMSLERQVRIAAGSLVVIGAGLGAFVHPAFLGLAGFVGAGLVFAGLTDTCGMALLLARMPWNQVADPAAACPPLNPDEADER